MKKILGTTLIAVAFAMVSTVDAKVMKKGAIATAQNVANTAVNAVDMASASSQDIKAAQNDIKDALSPDNLSADEREYAKLAFRVEEINKTIAFKQKQLDDIKYGLFGIFMASKETKAERNNLIVEIGDLEIERAQIKSDMKKLEPVVTSKFTKAINLIILGAFVVGAASAIDQYFGGHVGTFVMEKGAAVYKGGKEMVSGAGTMVKEQWQKRAPARLGGRVAQ